MRSSRCEWRRAWTIGRLTGCLPNPVPRHVGDHDDPDKAEIWYDRRGTEDGWDMPEIRPVTGACVWHGSEMAGSERWQRQLSPAQLAEIDHALRGARSR